MRQPASIPPWSESQNGNVPGCGMQNAGKHFDCGGFPSTVVSDECDGLSLRNNHADSVYRNDLRHGAMKTCPPRQGKILLQFSNFHSTIHRTSKTTSVR